MQDASSVNMDQAVALLVAEGYTREWAEELLKASSYSDHHVDAREWVAQVMSAETGKGDRPDRQTLLEEHHREGIPPYEPPARE